MSESRTIEASAASTPDEFHALQQVIAALQPLSDEARHRILDSASTFLNVVASRSRAASPSSPSSVPAGYVSSFSEDTSLSPKEFLIEKQPRTDVERVACLAYYLSHYRSTPHFKTLDLSKLNTEAAQPKFANAANSTNNAVKTGYLVPSTKGQRQLSAFGERFVRSLPDREAAKAVVDMLRRKPRPRRSRYESGNEEK